MEELKPFQYLTAPRFQHFEINLLKASKIAMIQEGRNDQMNGNDGQGRIKNSNSRS